MRRVARKRCHFRSGSRPHVKYPEDEEEDDDLYHDYDRGRSGARDHHFRHDGQDHAGAADDAIQSCHSSFVLVTLTTIRMLARIPASNVSDADRVSRPARLSRERNNAELWLGAWPPGPGIDMCIYIYIYMLLHRRSFYVCKYRERMDGWMDGWMDG